MRGRIVAIEGPSAVGKSSVARILAAEAGTRVLLEAFERLRPRPSLEFQSAAELGALELALLEEEARRYREAVRDAARGITVVADTGFLGPISYTAGLVRLGYGPPEVLSSVLARARELAARGAWGVPDLIVYLDAPRPERDRRAQGDAKGHPARLYARHARVARFERTLYRTVVGPTAPARLRFVRATGGPDAVARRIARAADRVPGRRPSRAAAERLLGAIERSVPVRQSLRRRPRLAGPLR